MAFISIRAKVKWKGLINVSTLKRPPAKMVQNFHLGQVGDDTIGSYLAAGFSLAICCKDCPRLIEWTPPELERLFGQRLDLRIADLAARFTCAGEGGCGSHDIAVFPHLYDGAWTWPRSADGA
jgi:hypothetical protein